MDYEAPPAAGALGADPQPGSASGQAQQVLSALSWAAQLAAHTDVLVASGFAGLSSVTA
jgi:hypothetical protein